MYLKIQKKYSKGFTLLELTVVCVILIALTFIVKGKGKPALTQADIAVASSDVSTYTMAASTYLSDTGEVPTDLDDLTLKKDTVYGEKGPWLTNEIKLDPWGNDYQYSSSNREIRSAGPDKSLNTDDDIFLKF